MFVSDRLNISKDIIIDKEDDDDIDERDNSSNRYGPPTANNNKKKKNKTMMLLMKKKKKEKKENICFGESSDGAASSQNINFSKPDKVGLFPFIKPNRFFHRKSTPAANTAASVASNDDSFPGNTSTSCFCFNRPPTLESSSTSTALQSQTSDPNHPNFTFDMLKSLIETNDFFSKECNPHSLDTTTTTTF